jgi:hypothetical protein
MRQKNMAMCPAEPGTKNDCAGEDQLKFTRPKIQASSQQIFSHLVIGKEQEEVICVGPSIDASW